MKSVRGLHVALATALCILMVLPVSAAIGVNGIDPSHGENTGTVFITNLSGTDFPGAVTVVLNKTGEADIPGQYVSVATPTRITCVFDLTSRTAGKYDVVVTNATDMGDYGVLSEGFEIVNLPPVVTSITPDNGENTATVPATIAGSGFRGPANVSLVLGNDTISATSVSVSWDRITCDLPITNAPTGHWDVVVTNYDGLSGNLTGGFYVRYPQPAISSIEPQVGTNDRAIGITNLAGTGFMPGANVTLSRSGYPDIPTIDGSIVIEPTRILCFFNITGSAVGPWDVVVTNTDGQHGVLPGGFFITYPEAPHPTVIDPATGENTGPVGVDVQGTGFQPNATVRLTMGGQNITGTGTFVNPPNHIATGFDLTGAPAGIWDLVVTNDDGQSGTLAGAFNITNPPPFITGVSPSTGVNTAPFTISNISGSGFLPGAQVKLVRTGFPDIIANPVTVVSPNQINATVDITGQAWGAWDVMVANTDGQSYTKPGAFTITNPVPQVYSIDPPTGENTGQVDNVVITGAYFLEGAVINLTHSGETSIPGTGVSFVNATTLTCSFDLTGAKAGAWNVLVEDPDGQVAELNGGFAITNPAPHVMAITPSSGGNDNSIGITNLSGTGFLDGAEVKLSRAGEGDIIATDVNVTSPVKIKCFFDLTGKKVGSWDVVVTNTDHKSGTLPAGFFIKYPQAPAVDDITPAYGANTGPVNITNLSGSGFHQGAMVLLSRPGENITATGVTVESISRISCVFDITGRATGAWDVVVINDDGQSGSKAGAFMVRYPAPTVTGIDPPKGDNDKVVGIGDLSGTGFRAGAKVNLSRSGENITATAVAVASPTKITCVFDLNGKPTGSWDVVVTNEDGQEGVLPNGFAIEYPAPTVSGIDPKKGPNNGPLFINEITGTRFRDGAAVKFTKTGQPDLPATGVHVINSTAVNCTVDLGGRAPGKWNVVVINSDGKSGVLNNGFEVTPPAAIPNFTASPTLGTVPLTVQFTDLSLNNPSLYIWDFGDGTIAGIYDRNPVHTYNAVGLYNVSLTVFNGGAPDGVTLTRYNYIEVVKRPVANFTAAPTEGNAPLLVQFTDTSDGDPVTWIWRFGDGSIATAQNPYHLYTTPGIYNVSLTVSNKAGTDSITRNGLITVRAVPTADFSANRTSGQAPLSVQFTDASTGAPTSWAWSFGDGTNGNVQNPVHVYTAPGTYNVRLTASNSAGTDTMTRWSYISVQQGLRANYTYTTSNPDNLAPLTVAFTDRSEGSIERWYWDFGDGTISTDRNPIHTFTRPGDYDVTLSVTDHYSGSAFTRTITVRQPLVADFSGAPTTGSLPLTVKFTDESIGTPNTWFWSFGDGQFMGVSDPAKKDVIHTYNSPGNYTVTLSLNDGESIATKDEYIHVLPFP